MGNASVSQSRPAIVLTRADHDRLSGLVATSLSQSPTIEFLRQEIERADIVADEATASVVTLGSRVKFIDHNSVTASDGVLVLPNEIEMPLGISVLSPLGSALLGLGPGQTIDWTDDAGLNRKLTVVAIAPRNTSASER